MKKWFWVTIGILSGGLMIAAAVIAWRKQSEFIKFKKQSAAYARDAKSAKSFRINDSDNGNKETSSEPSVSEA